MRLQNLHRKKQCEANRALCIYSASSNYFQYAVLDMLFFKTQGFPNGIHLIFLLLSFFVAANIAFLLVPKTVQHQYVFDWKYVHITVVRSMVF